MIMSQTPFPLCAGTDVATESSNPLREKLSLNAGWRFHPGDIPFPVVKGHNASYTNAKAGLAGGAAAPGYDDTTWREVTLPHDWAVEGPFDPDANLSQGFRPRGFAWYRRSFKLDPADKGKHLELQFDGIATHATVWLNGTEVYHSYCGYVGINIDLTPFAKYGDDRNTIAVRVDAEAQEGWWYEGAGIYRHTWLIKRAPVHLATDGVFANPVKRPDGGWIVPVEARLGNCGKEAASVQVETTVRDASGATVAQGSASVEVQPLAEAVARFAIPIVSPRLWSVDAPVLYDVQTVVKRDGVPVDAETTRCGFRTIRFDPDKGFFLNDQPLKLQGTCNHQDHAGVGVAVPDALWDFRIRRLKEMGSNAYRCAHNPPAAEFLDACDRLGMLVMDENRNFNCSPDYMAQLEWMVRRDRNHPSVILWSVFNEERVQGTETGYEMVRRMSAAVKKLDTTRPVTAAMSGGHNTPLNVSHAVDVVGFNYCQNAYDEFHRAHPQQPMTSSEDTSAFMTRGEYVTDKPRNIIGSYDDEHAPWGATHCAAWKAIAERPFLAGGFVWTGFDYRGEPTPHEWPSAGSFFGCMDLCGFPKTAFYLHQAQWIKDRPILQIVPHWNWAGREGQSIKVLVPTNAEAVELSLNGQSLGEQQVDPHTTMVSWNIPYAPGRLEAVGKKAGAEVARCVVETTGEPVALQLLPDRTTLKGDGQDALPVTVQAIDAKGRAVPTANLVVDFELTGPGAIIGLGNGNPNSHEPEKGTRRSLFNGLAQVILQSRSGGSGTMSLHAKAAGLDPASATISIKAVPEIPSVTAATPSLQLEKWRMSPSSTVKPDPNVQIADNDMNSWTDIRPGHLGKFGDGTWAILRSEKFKPYALQCKEGGRIVFRSITGKAEIWLDQKLVATKSDSQPAPMTVPLPAGEGTRVLSVLVETMPGQPAGLSGSVEVAAQ